MTSSNKHLAQLMFLLQCLAVIIAKFKVQAKSRPLIVGHRGAAGTIPESTVSGYKQAILDHADYIECDVLPTKDHRLICSHDPYLSPTTDVREHPEFANRIRNMTIPDYGLHEDWFCFDFTLDELKSLRVKQRYDFRDPSHDGKYQIATLDEFIGVAKDAERPVGIYPEIKLPELINSLPFMNGMRFEDLFLDALKRHGYAKRDDLCFIQSFSDNALRYLRNKTELRLIMMVWLDKHVRGPFLNESKLEEWGRLYYGLGAWKPQLVDCYDDEDGYKKWITTKTPLLLQEALSTGLKFHLYTFRNEDKFLAWNFKQDPINEYRYFDQLGDIEAYFTDFPATMYRAFEGESARETTTAGSGSVTRNASMSPIITFSLAIFMFCRM